MLLAYWFTQHEHGQDAKAAVSEHRSHRARMDPHFSEPVRIVCSDGNHDRNPARGMKRRRAKTICSSLSVICSSLSDGRGD
jgi:hypothetical protein